MSWFKLCQCARHPCECGRALCRQAAPRTRLHPTAQSRAAAVPLGYLSAAVNAPTFDRADVAAYTEGILTWWRTNYGSFKSWALAARIVFAISPNSASCERVFSLLKLMFGEQQISTLADAIRAALMLRYNDWVVG